MKKVIAIALLVLGGVFSAQADVELAGSFNDWNGSSYKFTDNGNNTFTFNLDLSTKSKNYNFKIVNNGNWLGATNLTLIDGTGNFIVDDNSNDHNFHLYNSFKYYTLTYNSSNNTLKVERSTPRDFVVTGESALLGSGWNYDDTNNLMTTTDNLVFTLTKENVQLSQGNHEYKIIADHSWGWDHEFGNWNGGGFDNFKLNIEEDGTYNVTFTLDLTDGTGDGTVTAVATKVGDDFTTVYTLVGDDAIAGSFWDNNDTSNDLTDNEDGTFSITKANLSLTAKAYPFKIISNHNWGDTQFVGLEGQFAKDGDGNALYELFEAGTYDFTFILTPETGDLQVIVNKVITLANEYTTVSSKHDLDWTGMDVYYATVNNDKVLLKKFNGKAAAGTGLLLRGAAGDVLRPVITYAAGNAPSGNKLVGVTEATTIGEGNNYVLSAKDGVTGFYKVASNVQIPAGKAYLHTDAPLATVDSNARVEWIFDDAATGINSLENVERTDAIYNLAGQRVAQPQKGLYIVNGKKIMVK